MIIKRNKKNGEFMHSGDVMKIASDSDKYIVYVVSLLSTKK